ncbi:MAG TPA: hypothetical protein VLU73_08020 [Methylococcaceae bacterium]|jgi:hypothetical protein|nr:hypothetical protein [Methylococcaceae bacterium]
MTSTPRELAEKVIVAFKQSLGPELRESITETQYRALGLMVREAVSDGMSIVLEQFEETFNKVRGGIERTPIDL